MFGLFVSGHFTQAIFLLLCRGCFVCLCSNVFVYGCHWLESGV